MKTSGVPEATVLAVKGRRVTVACPYCSKTHVHEIGERDSVHEIRAPGCGLFRSHTQRTTGYWFTIAGRDNRKETP